MTTTKRRKYRFADRADAELEVARLEAVLTNAVRAVAELVSGDVYWMGNARPYRVGLLRPKSPCGGVVIVEYDPGGQAPSYSIHNAEDFYHAHGPPGLRHPASAEAIELCELATLVLSERNRLAGYR